MKKSKPKPPKVRECDRRGNRCYSRDLCKSIGLQIYDRYAGDGAYGVILEINLHPNLVRKHRELIDAVCWSARRRGHTSRGRISAIINRGSAPGRF
jgi:hypothetical protein